MKATRIFQTFSLTLLVLAAPAYAQEATAKVTVKKPALPVAKATTDSSLRVRPLSVTVNLGGKTQIKGALTDTTSIEMKTSFGQATLPLSEVAGIRMANADSAMTTIVLHNGDSVTGAIDVQRLTVETEWGIATINGDNVTDVMFAPGLKWNSESGLNGVRWKLVAATAPSAPAPKTSTTASNQNRASSTTTSSGRVISTGQPIYPGQPAYGQPRIIRTR